MNNIPIYRGKRVDSDEYVEGKLIDNISISILDYKSATGMGAKQFRENIDYFRIDPTTLAIKDTKIDFFMSLDVETRKGGDIVQLQDGTKEIMECVFYKGKASFKDNNGRYHWCIHYKNVKAIGIKE